jgi:hypothetical protein
MMSVLVSKNSIVSTSSITNCIKAIWSDLRDWLFCRETEVLDSALRANSVGKVLHLYVFVFSFAFQFLRIASFKA